MPTTYLKLGGSLITDKTTTSTARPKIIAQLASQIAQARNQAPDMRLLLGHGSGSFGHVAAKEHDTRHGVRTPQQWHGFAHVWLQASRLHRIVIEALHTAGIPAISCAPSAGLLSAAGQVAHWSLTPIQHALNHGLVPVVYGDVVFDSEWGGTIFSTEDLFAHLTTEIPPAQILIAGTEPGVWADYPACTTLIKRLTPKTAADIRGAAATDVTGGMASKVGEMLALAQAMPATTIRIFGGKPDNAIADALLGQPLGTRITTD